MKRATREGEWPGVSAPGAPPGAVLYFATMVGDTPQDIYATNFRHPWQLGVFMRHVLDGAHEVWVTETPRGDELQYSFVVTRDASGEPAITRRFWAKLNELTLADVKTAADKRGDIDLPWNEEVWCRKARGERPRSFQSFTLGVEPEPATISRPSPASVATGDPEPPPKPPREPRAPRVTRDRSAITVASMADAAGVSPKDVRMELRKRKVEKPEAGWEFQPDDARLDIVKDIIKGLK